MTVSKHPKKHPRKELRLTMDARKRISLAKLLSDEDVCSFRAYTESGKIILEPMTEIPSQELWLYKNPKALESVHKGLDQFEKGKIKKSSINFSKFIDEEI